MSAELLRQAATQIRERAEAASPGEWTAVVAKGPKRRKQQYAMVGLADMRGQGEAGCLAVFAGLNEHRADDAEHVASWQPIVALAFADLLDAQAKLIDFGGIGFDDDPESVDYLAAAASRAYLGGGR